MPGLLRHAPAGVIVLALLLPGSGANAGAMTTPVMGGELVANPNPFSFEAGPLGTIYVTGAASGFASWQDNPVPGDRDARADLANGQLFVQKTDGWLQFYADAGVYTLPSLGTAFMGVGDTAHNTYGYLPQAWLKIAPTANFSIQAGQLAAIVGNENPFTFQNFNIERGLLWNQTPLFSRGVQAKLFQRATNPPAFTERWLLFRSLQLAHLAGFLFMERWCRRVQLQWRRQSRPVGLFQSRHAFGAEQQRDRRSAIYTHTYGSWIVSPYLQFSDVPASSSLGFDHDAASVAGAILASYAVTPEFFLAGRLEYINTTGNDVPGTPNLLYGPGSDAWSLTFTPTYQHGVFYARGEASYTGALDATTGDEFGRALNKSSQTRLMLEAGVVF